MPGKKVIVIGSGFGGMSAASLLARDGYDVTVIEKNDQPGGRAIVYREKGFAFDMGPSWYLMPDVFDKYFAEFGVKTGDYYDLVRLDPSYRVFFSSGDTVDIRADLDRNIDLFERREKGSGENLRRYLESA
ncbi:MAG: phytoene desaturase family protein, partial [Thermoplasmatota archaeon]